ncbi:SDR family NAD(P)-dependent oxidoreductase [Algiphilus sp. NNCM1]|uniref:SDR family NAD(P)-dependent oxidoreductase n=1 Tax=Algiphilus sp. TaxID=1872431 RepID=UPI001CA6EFA0|nr:SDR family NAD(P)-dependent oxidoreductase [Algiphilus sp.]MBY8966874.1 SDR family NAD(P)-dependent oxidoreductase [Algiphilus acroporae]MCI5062868.1 SDR family NAD(P)-dependent oxidoreductase [Algiphilus sp.]MCI5104455.1 SDR family NAD(P)-dependent oxidoreductase [Algiphilus sp.]
MKSAFITGAAVGQGNMLAKKLAGQGWRVFAGVLPGAETDLGEVEGVTMIEQDVSDNASVRASAEQVNDQLGREGLDLLMNVAGVANVATGLIEGIDMELVPKLFEINTFGQLRVCQAFLPMVRRAPQPAKILNFGSGAVLASPPMAGAYSMSKHAVHGLTLTLRNELAPFGVQVTSIWPGAVKTGMTANSRETTLGSWNAQPEPVKSTYAEYLKRGITELLPDMIEKKGNTPDAVTDEILKIVAQRKLKAWYCVGSDAKPLGVMSRLLPSGSFEALIRGAYKIPAAKV